MFAVATFVLATPLSQAADPQSYVVRFDKTGNDALDQALHDSSNLVSLRETAPAGPFALVERAREDETRFVAALHSFGYYKGSVDITIAGHGLRDSNLPDLLSRAPANPPVKVTVVPKLGPLFHIRKIDIEGAVPTEMRAQLGLKPGAPARAEDVLMAQTRLLNALRDAGYALAKVSTPTVIEDPAVNSLDVTYTVTTGPRVDFGKISIKGLHNVNQSFVERRLLIHSGEQFNPQTLEKARADLASLGVFASVQATTPDKLDAEGRIPVEFVVVERPAHSVSFGAAYSTDLGANLTASWSDRNLFGNAEQLNLSAAVQGGGTALHGPANYANAQFIKPDFLDRNQSLQADLGAVRQNLLAYDQNAVSADLLLKRTFLTHWNGSIGISGEAERIAQEGVTRNYTLIGLPLTVKYDDTNSLLDPTDGLRAAATVTPTHSIGGSNASFVLMQLSGSTYLNMSSLWNNPGRSVIALRGLIGTAAGATQFELPPDQRFYAGGSATVRGYKYQSIGPQFPDGNPEGGTSIVAGTVELRQRILSDYGFAAFVDGGQVSASSSPFVGDLKFGAGIGARYYTSFGPIRLDVAVPLTKIRNGGSFEIYLGIGQAF
ncbi:MAG: BamA/TamA family outer membrane protein [Alphaproteobacteria bacterium]|nr:BamA/TamA family outer membrane protein [Alphaproteobacteria bacterium]